MSALRIALSWVDPARALNLTARLIVPVHPSESAERVVLKILAWGLFHSDDLTFFSNSLCRPELPELGTLSGDRSHYDRYIKVGFAPPRLLRRVLAANPALCLQVVLASGNGTHPLLDRWLRALRAPPQRLELRLVPADLLPRLANTVDLNPSWKVVQQADHLSVSTE